MGGDGIFKSDEQVRFIKKDIIGHNILIGAAGTGKTDLALAKFVDIVSKSTALQNNVFLTYNRSLAKYAESITEILKKQHLFSGGVASTFSYHSFISPFCASRGIKNILYDSPSLKLVEKAIITCNNAINKKDLSQTVIDIVADEIRYIQEMGLDSFEAYKACQRNARMLRNIRRDKRKLYWDIYSEYLRLRELAGYDADWHDRAFLLLKSLKAKPLNTDERYDCIVLDEAQDCSKTMIELLLEILKPNGTFLYVGDTTQSIYGNRLPWQKLGLKIESGISKLTFNLRNSMEISFFAQKILDGPYWDKNIKETLPPVSGSTHGNKPSKLVFQNDDEEFNWLVKFLRAHTKQEMEYTNCIVLYNKKQCNEIVRKLQDNNIDAVFIKDTSVSWTDKVLVSTYHSVKGMGYDNIIIYDFNENFCNLISKTVVNKEPDNIMATASKLLYIAATRAKVNLVITSVGNSIINDFIEVESCYRDLSKKDSKRHLPIKAYSKKTTDAAIVNRLLEFRINTK